MPLTDEVLIKRTLAGNRAAFGRLIDRYQNFVFSLCLKVLTRREDAEEAAQDVFVKLYDRLEGFRGDAKFSTWLYTLTYRTAIDRYRSRGPRTLGEEDLPGRPQAAEGRAAAADFSLEQAGLKEVLQSAIHELPEDEGLIIELFYLQEQSVREIVEITGLTTSNVKTKLFRTREKLRKLLIRRWGQELDALRF